MKPRTIFGNNKKICWEPSNFFNGYQENYQSLLFLLWSNSKFNEFPYLQAHQSFKIPHLRINANYFIFIQAISLYGNKKLKSNITCLGDTGNLNTSLPLLMNNTNNYKCMSTKSSGSSAVQLKDMENMIDSDFIDAVGITYHISTKNYKSLIVSVDNIKGGTHLEICTSDMCPLKSILIFPEVIITYLKMLSKIYFHLKF